jgi:hypothetical protein
MTQINTVDDIFEEDADQILEKKIDGEYLVAYKD